MKEQLNSFHLNAQALKQYTQHKRYYPGCQRFFLRGFRYPSCLYMETRFLAANRSCRRPSAAEAKRSTSVHCAREKKLLVPLVKRYSLFSNGHLAMKTEDEENTGLSLKLILLKLCFDYPRFQKSQK